MQRLWDATGGLVLLEMRRQQEEERLAELKRRHRRIVDKQRQRRHRARVRREALSITFENGLVVKPVK